MQGVIATDVISALDGNEKKFFAVTATEDDITKHLVFVEDVM